MGTRISPAVRRRRLAMALRGLRVAAGLKAADVATELGCSPGKISQLENGRVAITVPDAKAMLELYGVTGRERDALVELARTAKQRGWWQSYDGAMRAWLRRYVGLEAEATVLRAYQTETVPDLLQTEEYQRALLARAVEVWSAVEVDELVGLRAKRQELLAGADAPTLWLVLGEGVLRRRVGSAKVMAAQLHRLLELSKRGSVNLQVLPFAAGAHCAMSGPFTVLEFPDPADPAVVYIEYLTGAHYLEGDKEVGRYQSAFADLTAAALSKTRSAALIRDLAREL